MGNRIKNIAAVLLLAACPALGFAQGAGLPADFDQLLRQGGLSFAEPLDAGYRPVQLLDNEYQNCQYAIASGKEDLQIRYFVMPWDDADPLASSPHVATFRALSSVATNADDGHIYALEPSQASLREDFNADWGMVYFFQPKPGFSEQPLCRLLAIGKEGKGMAFVFFLFDDPANPALDTRYLALRFR